MMHVIKITLTLVLLLSAKYILGATPKIPKDMLLYFVPAISDRNVAFIGSISIDVYEKSNMNFKNKENFQAKKLPGGWTEYSFTTADFVYDDNDARVPEVFTERFKIKVDTLSNGENMFLCRWICPVSGSMCYYSGCFIFSVETRTIFFEGEEEAHQFVVCHGSVPDTMPSSKSTFTLEPFTERNYKHGFWERDADSNLHGNVDYYLQRRKPSDSL